jgi:hypothetical protein
MADACVDWDVVTCADFDGELVHAASETVARQSEIAPVNAAFVVALTAVLPVPPALLFP